MNLDLALGDPDNDEYGCFFRSFLRVTRNGNATAILGFVLSAVAITAAMGAGTGVRLALWDFRQGFRILYGSACIGIAGSLLSLAGAILGRPGKARGGFLPAVAGIVLGTLAFGVPATWYRTAKRVPMIHDITTDTENPPEFVSIVPLRKDAPNPAEYGGQEIAAKQHAAYPDIRPLEIGTSMATAFAKALATARQMGWRIVEGNPREGRIEATATTRWFGFKDDIVIRIAPTSNNRCRLDIRSVSRVGKSDIGTNARRIRTYLKKFSFPGP